MVLYLSGDSPALSMFSHELYARRNTTSASFSTKTHGPGADQSQPQHIPSSLLSCIGPIISTARRDNRILPVHAFFSFRRRDKTHKKRLTGFKTRNSVNKCLTYRIRNPIFRQQKSLTGFETRNPANRRLTGFEIRNSANICLTGFETLISAKRGRYRVYTTFTRLCPW